MDLGVYLLVKKGDPDQVPLRKYITHDEFTIGRRGSSLQPELTFSSPYISRKHAVIRRVGSHYEIEDMMSKHGTEVNGKSIDGSPSVLRHGDHISLAKGAAELVFCSEVNELDATREYIIPAELKETLAPGLVIHLERREIRIDGTRLHLTGKDMDLLILLYQRANQAVSFEEIQIHIWPERLMNTDKAVPDVGRAEITALVYRLRKKLGRYGEKITTIPRYGYMLEVEEGG